MVKAKKTAATFTKRIATAKVDGTATKHGKSSRKVASESKASDAVDQQLARYRTMRDFSITSEPGGGPPQAAQTSPAGRSAKQTGLPFVIQKHAASHLHYDIRLGWNGVLKS